MDYGCKAIATTDAGDDDKLSGKLTQRNGEIFDPQAEMSIVQSHCAYRVRNDVKQQGPTACTSTTDDNLSAKETTNGTSVLTNYYRS